jgi:hypothetical protein
MHRFIMIKHSHIYVHSISLDKMTDAHIEWIIELQVWDSSGPFKTIIKHSHHLIQQYQNGNMFDQFLNSNSTLHQYANDMLIHVCTL